MPEKGKAKALIGGYQVAAENHDLAYFKQMLGEHAAAMEEDAKAKADQEEQKAAEKAAKSDKKKRKSEVKATEDVEMEDAVDAPKKGSKKRKKGAESEDEEQPEKVRRSSMCAFCSRLIITNSLQRPLKRPRSSSLRARHLLRIKRRIRNRPSRNLRRKRRRLILKKRQSQRKNLHHQLIQFKKERIARKRCSFTDTSSRRAF